jgi:uncharacterized protein YndB with AHSA1/START domain
VTEPLRLTIEIEAEPELVFDYFVEPDKLVRWMGDYARLEASDGGTFSVDINGVLIRGHFVRIERPRLIEIAWGELGNDAMPPGATRLVVRFVGHDGGTRMELEHSMLSPDEARKHALGWPHFLERLAIAGAGGDPGTDPWKEQR